MADLSLLQCIESEEKELYYVHGLTARYLLETMKETEKKKYHRRAAQLPIDLTPYLMDRGYLLFAVELLRETDSYFRLLLAVVNGKDYRDYLEEISEGLKELFEAI